MAVGQSASLIMTHRYRGQAPSHIVLDGPEGASALLNPLICKAPAITAYRQPGALLKCAALSVRRLHCAIYLG